MPDLIIVLEEWHVVEQGSHDELIASGSTTHDFPRYGGRRINCGSIGVAGDHEQLVPALDLGQPGRMLSEVRRTLAPGGILRLTTPDLRRYAISYLNGGGFFSEHRDRMIEVLTPAPLMPARPAFMVNQIFNFYGHRWIYDADELRYVLASAGFASAMRVCSFRQGAR